MKQKIFFNVDTQKDFMNKDGALYVPNAESIKGNLKKLTEFAADQINVISSVDVHYGTEEYKDVETELKKNGGPFPNHCMKGSEGCKPIKETFPLDIFTTYITKQTYDVFSNPITKVALKGIKEAVVYGVATDYCVKAAVLGMLKMGIKVTVVEDAIMGVAKDTTDAALKEMKDKGAAFVKTEEILK